MKSDLQKAFELWWEENAVDKPLKEVYLEVFEAGWVAYQASLTEGV